MTRRASSAGPAASAPGAEAWRALVLVAAVVGPAAAAQDLAPDYVQVPAGSLRSVLAPQAEAVPSPVAAFAMRRTPVTQAEYLRFVHAQPAWQRGRIPRTFAGAAYLQHWRAPLRLNDAPGSPPEAAAQQPVTQVSWFAAQAFCEAEGARLPSWAEWEYVAAADATRRDARADPAWRARVLLASARPAAAMLPAVGGAPNLYGLRDLHGLVWEWVEDFNALMVDADSRSGDDADKLKFCGAGALNLQDRSHYAVLMRIALLASLDAADSTASLGFRCVRPGVGAPPTP